MTPARLIFDELGEAPRGEPKACHHGREGGFSLIEVVITIGILMSLTIAVASMLRAGFDVKQGLSEKAQVVHRLATTVQKIADDLQHAFFVSAKDGVRNGIDRNMKTVFKIEKSGGDRLTLTTMTHRPMVSGANESEFTLVTYELKDAKDTPGRRDLYRAETAVVPLDIRDQPPERLLARGIKNITFEAWNGERWSRDVWDTGRSDTRNLIPKMVRVTIEAWNHDRTSNEEASEHSGEEDTDKIGTVVYLANSWDFQEKQGASSVKWDRLGMHDY